ncbi:MAG: GxGYxYP domain-containing protein [Armatimonadota bacterium]
MTAVTNRPPSVSRAVLLASLLGVVISALASEDAKAADRQTLVTFDLTPTDEYDLTTDAGKNNNWAEVHLVAALQGIVNRKQAQLYVTYVSDDAKIPGWIDRFWLDHLRGPGGWLEARPLEPAGSLEALVTRFRSRIKGVVLYDRSVPATSNVASTASGCEDLLPIPYDPTPGSVYDRLVVRGPRLPVKLRLLNEDGTALFTGSETGSAKCDAYLWAKRRYLDTGRCDPTRLAYYLDAWWLQKPKKARPNCHSLSNHDYFIARKAFFFDLSPWDDEAPQDDTTQPLGTDYKTLSLILRAAYDQTRGEKMIHVGGFVPWAWKYTVTAGGKHGDVASEWQYGAILSCYNAYMDADALGLNAMANASVFAHFPLKRRYEQPKPTIASLKKAGFIQPEGKVAPRTYISFYVGDYDAAAWLYQRLPTLWNDPARGTVPLGWAFNPNLAERFPVGMDWARRTATPRDHFIAGDSGAGYLNPGNLDRDRVYSHLPSGLPVWEKHCARFYRQWDISMTGFVIDGFAPPMSPDALAAYARFSPDGFAAQKLPIHGTMTDWRRLPSSQGIVPGSETPFLTMSSDMPNGHETAEAITRIQKRLAADTGIGPHFHLFRTILWTPSQHKALFERVNALPNVVVVDPYTLTRLLRETLKAS